MLCPDAGPLRPFADRRPAHRGRADGALQLAARARPRRRSWCCASRTPTASARRPRTSSRSSTRCAGSARLGRGAGLPAAARRSPRRGRRAAARPTGTPTARTPAAEDVEALKEEHGNRGFRGEDEGEGAVRLRVPDDGVTVVNDVIRGESAFENALHGRPRDRPRRRHADLPPRRGGGRRRHGHHPRRARRRPLLQHAQADAHPAGDGGAGADLRARRRCSTGPTARSCPSATAPHPCRICATRGTCRRRSSTTWRCSAGATTRRRPSSRSRSSSERFSLERVSKSPAVFDEQKLRWMNGRYLRELDVDDLTARLEALTGRERTARRGRDLAGEDLDAGGVLAARGVLLRRAGGRSGGPREDPRRAGGAGAAERPRGALAEVPTPWTRRDSRPRWASVVERSGVKPQAGLPADAGCGGWNDRLTGDLRDSRAARARRIAGDRDRRGRSNGLAAQRSVRCRGLKAGPCEARTARTLPVD